MLTKYVPESTKKKKAFFSVRSEEKHIDFDLSTGEDQDLNFNLTTGSLPVDSDQDDAKLLSNGRSTLELQVNKTREELVRSEESSQESESSATDAWTTIINSSRADFFMHTDLSFEAVIAFFFQNLQLGLLHEEAS